MEVGIGKCAIQIRNGKRQITEGIELSIKERIKTFREKETDLYFGILEAETIR